MFGMLTRAASRLASVSGSTSPRAISPAEVANIAATDPLGGMLLGNPRTGGVNLTQDNILSDLWVQPYRGPLDLDPYGQETAGMREQYRTQYRTSPVTRAAVRGFADDVSTQDPRVVPQNPENPTEKLAAEFLHWTISNAPRGWRGVIDTCTTPGMIDGYALAEIKLEEVHWKGMNLWGLAHLRGLDSKYLRLQLDQYRNIMRVVNFVQGIQYYQPEHVVLYSHNPMYSNPFGQSSLRATTRASALIEDVYKVWFVALKVYGLPYMVAKGKATNRKALGQALDAIRGGGWAVTELDESIEVLNLAAGAGKEIFSDMLRANREDTFYGIRSASLPFLEGDGKSGSHGNSQVEQETSDAGERGTSLDVADALRRQLFRALLEPNFGKELPIPNLYLGGHDWALTDKFVGIVDKAQKIGADVSKKQFHAVTGLAVPEDLNDKLAPVQPQQPGAGGMPGMGAAQGAPQQPQQAAAPQAQPEQQPATFSEAHRQQQTPPTAEQVRRSLERLLEKHLGSAA